MARKILTGRAMEARAECYIDRVCFLRPSITTDNGDLKFSTAGSLVFEAGSPNIRFQSLDGQLMEPPEGFKGEKVQM